MSEQPPEVQSATRYPDFLSLCLVRLNPPSRSDAAMNVGIARKLAEMLRASDLVGMVGEDIAVILVHKPDTDAIGISARMQRALQEFALAASSGGRSGPVSVEFALAAFPGDA